MTIDMVLGKTIQIMRVVNDEFGVITTLTFTDDTELNISIVHHVCSV